MVGRRGFLAALVGVAAAPFVPVPKASQALKVGDVFTVQGSYVVNPIGRLTDPHTGIAIRYIQQFDVVDRVTRMDVLYGVETPR